MQSEGGNAGQGVGQKGFGSRGNHRVDNELIVPVAANGVGNVSRRKRLGGLLNFYYREAA